MSCKRIVLAVLTLVAMMALPATAEIVTTAVYNPGTQQIEYALTGGQNGTPYEIKGTSSGCVDTLNDPPDFVGPDGAGVVGVVCTGGPGAGRITIEFCDEFVCFSAITINFNCNESCDVEVGRAVPGLTGYSIAALVTVLLLTGLAFRRRRQKVTA